VGIVALTVFREQQYPPAMHPQSARRRNLKELLADIVQDAAYEAAESEITAELNGVQSAVV